MDTPAERVELELSGTRAYDRRDLEDEATSEDPFWVDLCALHRGSLGEGEILDKLYKPRRLLLRSLQQDGPRLEVLLPPEGCSREDLRVWRRECGGGEGAVFVEIRRYGKAAYYGAKTWQAEPELLPPEPAPLVASSSPPTAPLQTPSAHAGGLELLARKLMSPEGPEWAQQMVALVGGAGLQLMLVYKEKAVEVEELARVRAEHHFVLREEEEKLKHLRRLRREAEAEARALEEAQARLREAQRASGAPVLPVSPPAAAPSYAPQTSPQTVPQGVPAPAGVPAYAR